MFSRQLSEVTSETMSITNIPDTLFITLLSVRSAPRWLIKCSEVSELR